MGNERRERKKRCHPRKSKGSKAKVRYEGKTGYIKELWRKLSHSRGWRHKMGDGKKTNEERSMRIEMIKQTWRQTKKENSQTSALLHTHKRTHTHPCTYYTLSHTYYVPTLEYFRMWAIVYLLVFLSYSFSSSLRGTV